jgi:Zn-dependent protease
MAFRLGSIPVRVHGSFFVMALLMRSTSRDLTVLAVWTVCLFASVLLHELGHALVGRSFGLEPRIDLHGMGGTTSWTAGRGTLGPLRSISISLAGPFAGFAFGALLFVLRHYRLVSAEGELVDLAFDYLLTMNIVWSALNLLPMLPLDGGNILAASLNGLTKGKGDRPARMFSIALASAIGLYFVARALKGDRDDFWYVFVTGIFVVSNVRALRAVDRTKHDRPLREALESAYEMLNKGEHLAAARAAEPILREARTPEVQADALRLLGFAYFFEGRWEPLLELLEGPLPHVLRAEELDDMERTAKESGHAAHAERIAAIRAGGPPRLAGDFRSASRGSVPPE